MQRLGRLTGRTRSLLSSQDDKRGTRRRNGKPIFSVQVLCRRALRHLRGRRNSRLTMKTPVQVEIHRFADRVTIYDPDTGIFGTGEDELTALEDFQAATVELFLTLHHDQDALGPGLRETLCRLEAKVQAVEPLELAPADYTSWRTGLWPTVGVEELSREAMQFQKKPASSAFESYQELDLGPGGGAIATSTEVRQGVQESIRRKHRRSIL